MRKILIYCLVIVSALAFPYARYVEARVPTPVRIIRRPVVKKQTLLQKIWSAVGPGILGSAGVVAGSAVAWYTLRKKGKTFDIYYQQIFQAQERYKIDHNKANFKSSLLRIQEDAELTAARKKLDQEQLTAIVNKVKRMLGDST